MIWRIATIILMKKQFGRGLQGVKISYMHNPKKLLRREDFVLNKKHSIVATKSPDAWNYYILYFLLCRGVNTIAFNYVYENMVWQACEKGDTS